MARTHSHSAAIRIALETRLMFDGAAVATAEAAVSESATAPVADGAATAPEAPSNQAPEFQSPNEAGSYQAHDGAPAEPMDPADVNSTEDLVNALTATAPAEGSNRQEIYFFDSSLPDQHVLLAALPTGAEVVYLDNSQDGLSQMAEALRGRSGLDAIHIVTHASAGVLQIGGTTLDAASIEGQHSALLAEIGAHLNANADVLLYGCDLSAGDEGMATVNALAKALTSDIAASSNTTGQAGDWVLETHIGTIETASLHAHDWQHTLLVAAPVNDAYTVNSNSGPTTLNVVSNDIVVVGAKVGTYTNVANGTLSFNASNNIFTYTPKAGFSGTDTFNYTLVSGLVTLGTATVTITVNAAPTLTVPTLSGLTEDTAVTFSSATGTQIRVADVDNTTSTVTLSVPKGTLAADPGVLSALLGGVLNGFSISGNNSGSVTLTGPITSINNALNGMVYTPVADANGAVNLTLTATDPSGLSTNSIIAMNFAPVADIVADNETAYINTPSSFNVLANDSFENAARAVSSYTQPAHGTVTITAQGDAVYTPATGWIGTDTFTYTVSSGGATETATVTVTTVVPNYAPTISLPTAQTFAEDTVRVFSTANGNAISVADANGDNLTVRVSSAQGVIALSQTTGLTVTGNGTGTVTLAGSLTLLNAALNGLSFTPTADYYGAASLTVTANDGQAALQSSTVTMTITPVVDGVTDSINTGPLKPVTFYPLANDNFENANATVTGISQPTRGVAVLGLGGAVTYTPALGFVGTDTFTYTVTSGGVTEQVAVNVTVGNSAPVGSSLGTLDTVDKGLVLVTASLAFSDPDLLDVLRFSATGLPAGLAIDPLTGIITGVVNGHASVNGVNGSGTYNVVVTATDLAGATATSNLTINVTNPPPIPVLGLSIGGTEDALLNIGLDALLIIDPDGDDFSITKATALNGTVTIKPDGSLSYQPNPNYFGLDTITYVVRDVDGGEATGTVLVVLAAVPDLPILNLPSLPLLAEDTPLLFANLLGQKLSIGDVDGGLLRVDLRVPLGDFTLAESGGVTLSRSFDSNGVQLVRLEGSVADINVALGNLIYTPAADYNGPLDITVDLSQLTGGLLKVHATLPITIVPVADIVDDHVRATLDTPIAFNVLANDTFENPTRIVSGFTTPAHGTVTIDAQGNAIYTPNPGYLGADRFTYTVTSNGTVETATVYIDTALPNYGPTIVTQAPSLTIAEDTPLVFSSANGNALIVADGNDDVLTVTLTANRGALQLADTAGLTVIDGNGADGTLTVQGRAAAINAALNGLIFTPTADYYGAATISVTASDGVATVQNASVNVTITPVVDGVADSVQTEPLIPVTFYPLANDSFEGTPAITGVGAAAHGTVLLIGNAVTYTPNVGFRGADSFTYTVTSGGVTETISVNVTVGTNHAPTATSLGSLSTVDGGLITVPAGLAFADIDLFDRLTFSASNLPAGLSINPLTGLIAGQVDGHASQVNGGVYSVVVTATDLAGASVSSTLTINISNPPPLAGINVAITLDEDTTRTIPRSALAIVDIDGDDVFVTGASAGNGTVSVAPDGSLTYTPKPNFFGLDTITYTIRDADGGTATGLVAVTVLPVLNLPTISIPVIPVFAEDTPILLVSALGQSLSVGDVDGKLLDLTLTAPVGTFSVSQDSNISVIANASGTLRLQGAPADLNTALAALVYTPGPDYNGPLNISIQLGQLTSALGSSLNVASLVNLTLPLYIAPVADIVDDEVNVLLDTPAQFNVMANDTFENAGRVVSSISQPEHGSVTFDAQGNMIYTPVAGFTGNDRFTYTVTSNGTVETATVTLHVALPNYAPTLTAPASQTFAEDTPLVFSTATGNPIVVADRNDDVLTVTLSTSHGALSLAQSTGVTLVDGNGADGSLTLRGNAAAINSALNGLTLTPIADYYGPATLSIVASDGSLNGSTSIGLTITPVADGVTDNLQTGPLAAVNFYPLANDTFEGNPVITGYTQGNNGAVSLGPGGLMTYVPRLGYSGPDSFTYTVTSGGVTETVAVNVTVGNQAPTTTGPLPAITTVDGALLVSVPTALAFRDADVLDVLRFSATGLPAGLSIDPLTGIIAGKVDGHASTVNNGVYVATVTATDLAGASVSTTLAFTVSNPAPVTADIAVIGNEDTTLVIPRETLAIVDPDGDDVSIISVSAEHGVVTFDAQGNLSYTPNANYNGLDTIRYTVRDADGATADGIVRVTVLPVLDLPTLQVPTIPIFAEDTPLVFADILGQQLSVADVDGKLLDIRLTAPIGTFTLTQSTDVAILANANGTLHLQGTPTDINAALAALVYTPGADYNGRLNIAVQLGQLTDALGSQLNLSSLVTATLPLTIAPVADIVDDNVQTTLDAPIAFNVLANDTFENAGRFVSALAQPQHGSVTFDAGGNIVYTPDAGYLGVDTFTYTVISNGTTETATVTVTIGLPNYAPTVTTPVGPVFGSEDTPVVFGMANGNSISVDDLNGDVLTVTLQTDHGDLTLSRTTGLTFLTGDGTEDGVIIVQGSAADINAALEGLLFRPTPDYNGPASISIQAFDGIAAPQSATIALTLAPVTDGRADTVLTEPLIPATISPLANDSFSDPNARISSVSSGAHGTVVLGPNNTVTYIPGPGFRGADSFTYTVSAGGVTETVAVNVIVGTNQPPVAVDLAPRTTADGATVVIAAGLAFTDADLFDTLRYSATGLPAGLSIDPNTGVISGTVNGHASTLAPNGQYAVVVTATDLAGASATSLLQLQVLNPAPIPGVNVAVTATEDTSLTIPYSTLNVVDPDGDSVTVVAASASHGSVTVAANGALIYTPNANYNGVDVITYTVRDADGATANGLVAVTVLPVMDLPTVQLPSVPVFAEDTPLVFAELLGQRLSVGDVDGKLLDVTVSAPIGSFSLSQASTVTIVGNANGALHLQGTPADINAALALLVYTPGLDYNGSLNISVQVGQLTGLVGSSVDLSSLVTATLPITISPVADVVDDQVAVTASSAAAFNVLANDTFENAGRLLITHTEPAHGSVTIDRYGNAVYVPNPGFTGNDSFTYTVESNGTLETGTVTLTVTLPNYAPTVTAPSTATLAEDTPFTFVGANAISVADLNGDRLTVTLLVNHGTLTLGQTAGLTLVTGDGTADALMVFSGTPADINAALAGLTFTPTADYHGSATLNLQVSDGVAAVQTANIALAITPVVDGVADSIQTGPLSPVAFNPLANDTFSNPNAAITAVSAAAHGTVVLGLNGLVTYTPAAGYSGPDSFTYTVTSGGAIEIVIVNVTVGNQAPTAVGSLGSLGVNDGELVVAVSTAQAFRDADTLDVLRFSATGLPAGLSIDPATGLISGQVDGHASVNGVNGAGQYTVTVTARDLAGATASTTLLITVANPAPIPGVGVSVIGAEDTPIAISANLLNVIDPDGDSVIVTGASALHGTVAINPVDGSLTYTPNADYNGPDTITYTVRDADGATAVGTVAVTVVPVPDLPTITLPSVPVLAEDTALVFANLLGQRLAIGDVDGELLELRLSVPVGSFTLGQSANVNITEDTGGTIRVQGYAADINAALAGLIYTPGADYNGNVNITLQVGQLTGGILNISTVLPLTIARVADIVADQVRLVQGTPVTFNVLDNDTFENPAAAVTAIGGLVDGLTAYGGSVTFSANGQIVYTPAAGFVGVDTFTYTVTSNGTTETATVTLTVAEPNYAPTLNVPGTQSGTEDTSLVLAGTDAIRVADSNASDILTVTLTADHGGLLLAQTTGLTFVAGSNGASSLTISGSASALNAALDGLVFRPVPDYYGNATLQVSVSDGIAAPVNGSVALYLAPVADGVSDTIVTEPLVPVTLSPLANDTFENPNATVAAASNGANGSVVIGPDNTLIYTPNPGFRGVDTFTYTVTSGGVTETVSVVVTVGVNHAPVAGTLAPVNAEDGAPVSIPAATAFTDSDLFDRLTFTASNLPAGLSIDPQTGLITGTVDTHASVGGNEGRYAVVITATDLSGASASTTLLIQISNPAPVPGAGVAVTGQEDTPLTIPRATLNIVDPDGDEVVVTGATAGHGSVAIGADGSLIYTPARDYNGTDVITYTVRDADGGTATGTVVVTVLPVMDPPTVQIPTVPVFAEDTPLVFASIPGLAFAVGDVDGKILDLTLTAPVGTFGFSGPTGGTVVTNVNGVLQLQGTPGQINAALSALVYTPGADYNGNVDIRVTLGQLVGVPGSAVDNSSVVSCNLLLTIAPVADIVDDHVSITGEVPVSFNVLANDNFENPSRIVSSVDTSGTVGNVAFSPDGTVIYTPAPGFVGIDRFTYTVTSNGTTETATVTVVVDAVPNTDPIAQPLPDTSALDGQSVRFDISGAFSDPDGDALTFTARGLPSGLSIDPITGQITGTLSSDASSARLGGAYVITVTAADGRGGEVSESFTLTVGNPAPIAGSETFSVDRNTVLNGGNAVTGDLRPLVSDPDGDAFAFQTIPVQAPAHGTLVLRPDGTFTYTPALNFSGTDRFAYQVIDTDGGVATGVIVINVVPVNEAPVAQGTIAAQTGVDNTPFTLAIAGRFTDIDGDVLTYSASGLPSGIGIDPATGLITGQLNKSASTQGLNGSGVYNVIITATDGAGESAQQTFVLTVSNPAPVTSGGAPVVTAEDTPVSGQLTATDADGDALTFSVVQAPTHGLLTLRPDGSYTYVPAQDYFGPDSFSYRVTDADGASAVATVTLIVTPVNDAPVAVGTIAAQTAVDGAAFRLETAANFADVDNPQLAYSATGLPLGLIIDPVTGVISGSLGSSASAFGPYTVTITASDGLESATQTFVLTVTNPAPSSAGASFTVNEDGVQAGTLTAEDADGDALTFSLDTAPAHGTVVVNPDGTYVYTPAPNYNGPDRFSYTVTDADGASVTALVTITVLPVNDAPDIVAPIAPQATADGAAFRLDVSGNFNDVDGDALRYTASGLPAGLTINRDTGVISGTLASQASSQVPGGIYTVTVTANDGNGGTVSQSFLMVVSNPPPVAMPQSIVLAEDSTASGTLQATDPDGDPLTFSVAAAPQHGTLALNPNGTFTYTPNRDYNGTDRFTYQVRDIDGGFSTAVVELTITPVNDAPNTVGAIAAQTGTDGQPFTLSIADRFADIDGDVLSFSASGLPAGLTLTNGVITGVLDRSASVNGINGSGVYNVTLTATDPSGETATQTFTLTVTNPAPVAGDTSLAVREDTPFAGTLTAVDPDGDSLSFALATDGEPAHGTVVINPDGTFVYTPALNFHGLDSFTYQVTDSDGGSTTAVVSIVVAPVNDAPETVGAIGRQTGTDGQPFALNVNGFFRDVDGDTLAYTATGLPVGLSVNAATGLISGTLGSSASAQGPYTVVVTATDPSGASVSQSFVLEVTNPVPVTADAAFTTDRDTALTGQLIATDLDGDALTFTAVTGPANGTLVVAPNGSFTYVPNAGFVGADSFTYQVQDADGGIASATVTLTVAAVNDAPVASAIPTQSGTDGAAFTLPLSAYFSDANGDLLSFDVVGLPNGLTFDAATGVISGTLSSSASAQAPYTIAVTVTDPSGASVSQSFVLEVTNPVPVTADAAFTTDRDTVLTGQLIATDLDGDALTFTAVTGPANGTLVVAPNGSFTYVPNTGFVGTDTFTYQVRDADGGIASATVNLTVAAVNDAPVASAIPTQSATDGAAFTLPLSAYFSDANGDLLSFDVVGLPNGLTFDAATGVISGTLSSSASAQAPYTIAVTVTDPSGASVSQSFVLEVTNPLPVTQDSRFTVEAGGRYTGQLIATDADGDALRFGLVQDGGPRHGVLTLNADGSFNYAPFPGFSGSDRFTYSVTDADGAVVTAVVDINVSAIPNVAPSIVGSIPAQQTEDGAAFRLDVSGAFRDGNGDPLVFSAVGLPGGLRIDPVSGVISGQLDASASQGGTNGVYRVTLTASDGQSSVGIDVSIAVTNPAPIAADSRYTLLEDGIVSGQLSGTNPDGDALTFSLAPNGGPQHGTVIIEADGRFSYVPDANYNGPDRFTYVVRDADGGITAATVTLDVLPVNDAPVNTRPIPTQTAIDARPFSLDVSTHFADIDSPQLTYGATGLPAGLSIDPATGRITGTLASNASTGGLNGTGVYSVTITASDGQASIGQIVTFSVANPVPVAADSQVTLNRDSVFAGQLNAVDPDGDAMIFSVGRSPANGTVIVNADGSFVYTPNPRFVGTDSFTYIVRDSDGGTTVATVTLAVVRVNEAPIPGVNSASTGSGVPVTLDVLANATDPDGDVLGISGATAANGTVVINANGTLTYTPRPGFTGIDVITYRLNDGTALVIATATVLVNDPPVARPDTGSSSGNPIVIDVLANDTDPNGHPLTVIGATAGNGSVTIGPDGSLTYTPAPGFTGTDTLTYTVSDGFGGTARATVSVSVSPSTNAVTAPDSGMSMAVSIAPSRTVEAGIPPSGIEPSASRYTRDATYDPVLLDAINGVKTLGGLAGFGGLSPMTETTNAFGTLASSQEIATGSAPMAQAVGDLNEVNRRPLTVDPLDVAAPDARTSASASEAERNALAASQVNLLDALTAEPGTEDATAAAAQAANTQASAAPLTLEQQLALANNKREAEMEALARLLAG